MKKLGVVPGLLFLGHDLNRFIGLARSLKSYLRGGGKDSSPLGELEGDFSVASFLTFPNGSCNLFNNLLILSRKYPQKDLFQNFQFAIFVHAK